MAWWDAGGGGVTLKRIAIIGPFTAPTAWQRDLNIDAADMLAFEVWKLGAYAYCPHRATGHWFQKLDEAHVIAGHRAIMADLDAALLLPGWRDSEGSIGDRAVFDQQDKPVFETLDELKDWLRAIGRSTNDGDNEQTKEAEGRPHASLLGAGAATDSRYLPGAWHPRGVHDVAITPVAGGPG